MPNSQTRTILVHVDRIWASRLRFRVGVYLTRTQASDVVRTGTGFPSRTRETELLILLRLSLVQQLLIPLQALCRSPANDGCYRAPLGWHKLGEVQELLVLRLGPLCLFDRGIEPFVPPGFALLGSLSDE